MPSDCWLCVHCDRPEIVEMMRFVEEKSPVMHIDVIATEISQCLRDSFPDDQDEMTEDLIKQHVARHVVTPVASITRITRDLLDICETLRPSQTALERRRNEPPPQRKRRKKAQKMEETPTQEQEEDEVESIAGSSMEGGERCSEEEIGMYLRTVNQVMQIYRLHGKMLQPPN